MGTGQGRLIHRWVDLVELLAGLDLAAFGKQTLEDDAIDLRAYFGNAEGRSPARQVGGQGVGLGLQGYHANLRRMGHRCRFFLFAAA
ncbi:hypothetical protein D3C81_1781910 [compost metagenome]